MRFVADDQIPPAVWSLKLLLHVLISRELVQSGDDKVRLHEPIASSCCLKAVIGEDLEW